MSELPARNLSLVGASNFRDLGVGSVQTVFLAAAFEAIDADYGDLESYFRDSLGLGAAERAALRARYLEA